jgi:hypothetical protein
VSITLVSGPVLHHPCVALLLGVGKARDSAAFNLLLAACRAARRGAVMHFLTLLED